MPVPDYAHGVTDSNYWFAHLKTMDAPAKSIAVKTDSTQTAAKTASTDSSESFFDDLVDIVNPLQHFPVVSTIYRAVTGDKIGDVEKVAGDALYGGPIGLVSSLADVAFEHITGKDFGDTIMVAIGLGGSDNNTALAGNAPKPDAGNTVASATPKPASQPLIVANAVPTPLIKLPETMPATDKAKSAAAPSTQAPSTATADAAAKSDTPVNISPDTDALLQALARNGVTGQLQAQALDAYRRTMQMNSGTPAAN